MSFAAARLRNEVPNGRALGLGAPDAQILLFVADVLLLVGHIPIEGVAVNTEAAGPSLVRNKLDICGKFAKSVYETVVVVPLLTV